MFDELEALGNRPKPFEFYTARELWTDEHISSRMLALHLDDGVCAASRSRDFIDSAVEWMAGYFGIGATTKIADFGCGPGLYARRFAQKGAQVTGVDFSKNSIEYARNDAIAAGLDINYVIDNYLEFDTSESFDLIVMIMCDFCALSPAQRNTLLGKFRKLLNPGGHIVLDVYSLGAFARREEAVMYKPDLLDGFWSAKKYHGFLNTFKYMDEKVILDKYTIIEESGSRVFYNWLQYFSPEAVQKELQESGFTTSFFSDVAGSPFDARSDEFAVVAAL
jgi:SAM-dependent methyltransferase